MTSYQRLPVEELGIEAARFKSSPSSAFSSSKMGSSYAPEPRTSFAPERRQRLGAACLKLVYWGRLHRGALAAFATLVVILLVSRTSPISVPENLSVNFPAWLDRPARTDLPPPLPTFFSSPSLPLPVSANLSTRLQHWSSAPIADAERWRAFNDKTCKGRTEKNEVWQMVNPNVDKWMALTAEKMKEIRDQAMQCLRSVEAEGRLALSNSGHGRGLVFTAGNGDTLARVLVTLRMLRRHSGLKLPAEIFHYRKEMVEVEVEEELKALGATVRVVKAEGVKKEAEMRKNYQIKASAIIESSFQEVLYLDSDNTPCGSSDDVLALFDAPAYKRLGAFFWPDMWKTSPANAAWRVLGVQCRDEWEFETGAILIDKSKHLDALYLTQCMLIQHQTWFTMSNGDKDIFRYAFLALRKRWAVPGRHVAIASVPPLAANDYSFAGHTMVQYDHRGNELFVHGTMLKSLHELGYIVKEGTTWGVMERMKVDGGEGNGDVEADMLVNAKSNGMALMEAPAGVRTRAALERGVKFTWKSLPSILNFLVVEWSDPRKENEVYTDAHSPTGIDWRDPFERVQWDDLPQLKDFEHRYYEAGAWHSR